MKTLQFLIVIWAPMLCYGAVGFEPPNKLAAAGHCLSSDKAIGSMKYGEVKSIQNQCGSVTCNSDGSLDFESCGAVGIPDNCQFIKPDGTKPYPGCCMKDFKCT